MLHQMLKHCKPIQPRHLHIEKNHIRLVLLNQFHSLNAVFTLRQHLHVLHGCQQKLQLLASQTLVVHNKRSDRHGDWSSRGPGWLQGFVFRKAVRHQSAFAFKTSPSRILFPFPAERGKRP